MAHVSGAVPPEPGAVPETRFWELATGRPIGVDLAGHPLGGSRVRTRTAGDLSLLIGTEPDGALTLWEASRVLGDGLAT